MIRSIAFLEPASDIPNIYSYIAAPRLGVPVLGRILKDAGYDVSIFSDKIRKAKTEELRRFDLIGVSSLTNASTRGYEYADAARRLGKPVVIGGPHATFLPDEALDHCDYVVRGEAEETLLELIRALDEGTPLDTIHGLSFRRDGTTIHTPDRIFTDRYLDVSPDLSLVEGIEPFKKGLLSRFLYTPMVYTSRGCPFTCRYCSVIKLAGRKLRYRGLDNCVDDVRKAAENVVVRKSIMLVDDNFTVNMPRAKEMLRRMIHLGKPDYVLYNMQLRVETFKDQEFLSLLNQAGFGLLHVGFESINKDSLREWKKTLGVDQIRFVAEQAAKYGLKINAMFIVGSDSDTEETVADTVNHCIELDVAVMQLFILCPLPGTDVYHQFAAENRLFTRDWRYYDCHHSVFFPKNVKPSRLQRAVRKANEKFYSPKRMFLNHAPGNRVTCGAALHSMRGHQRAYEIELEAIEAGYYSPEGTLITERLN